MTISFACPHCGRPFKVPDSLAGKRARCKTCDRIITVPEQEREILVLSEEYVVKPEKPAKSPPSSGFLEALDEPLPGRQDADWLSEAMGDSQPLLPTSGGSSRDSNSSFYVWLAVGCVGAAVLMFASLMIISLMSKRQMRAAGRPAASSDSHLQAQSNSEREEDQEPNRVRSDSPSDAGTPPGPYTKVPGTRISLIKPEGFSLAKAFAGFQQEDTSSSIMVVEMPAPYREVIKGFSDVQKMNLQGMKLLLQEEVVVDGQAARLYQLRQTAQGTAFVKWVVAFGDDTHVVMINAMCPEIHKSTLAGPLRQAALSVKYDQDQAPDPNDGLPFTITHQGKLKRAGRITNMLMYTLSGEIPAPSPEDPLFVVAESISSVSTADAKTLAEQRLHQTATVTRISIQTTTPITVDGLRGYEIEATADHLQSGVPLAVYQVMLFDGGTYILMQGMVGTSRQAEFLPEFKALARSLRRTDSTTTTQ